MLLRGIDVLLNATEYDLHSSERGRAYWRHQKHVTASRRASPASPSATSRDPSLVTITPDVVASYADERRPKEKDEPRDQAGGPTDPTTAANHVIAPIPEI